MNLNLKIHNYRHSDEKIDFFSDIEMDFSDNGFHMITGSSGVGKSTLIKIILGINSGIVNGEVTFSEDNKKFTNLEMRKNGWIGYQPDDFSLIPWLTIDENIMLPFKINKKIKDRIEPNVKEMLTKLGLESNILELKPHQISFGMKARINLIRSCISCPKILILDELYSGLDKPNCKLLNSFLKPYLNNTLILAISHQYEIAENMINTLYHIDENRTIQKLN